MKPTKPTTTYFAIAFACFLLLIADIFLTAWGMHRYGGTWLEVPISITGIMSCAVSLFSAVVFAIAGFDEDPRP